MSFGTAVQASDMEFAANQGNGERFDGKRRYISDCELSSRSGIRGLVERLGTAAAGTLRRVFYDWANSAVVTTIVAAVFQFTSIASPALDCRRASPLNDLRSRR